VRRQAWLPGTAGTRSRFAGTVAEPADRWATGHGKDELTRISHNYDVFSSALSLPVGVFSPALLASSVASDAAISVCFAPEDDCAAFAVRTIDNAEREILIGVYGVITGSGIVEALVRAKERGVDVRLIAYRPPFRAQRQYRAPHRGGNVYLEAQERPFVLVVRSKLWSALDGRMGQRAATRLRCRSAGQCPQRLSAAPGAKGERLYNWAWVRLFRPKPPWDRWLLIRRCIEKPDEFVYYVVFGGANTALSTPACVAGQRCTIETCSEVAKQEVGPDDDEVRRWPGWYRHITLAMLAFAFLAAMRARLRPGNAASDKKREKCLVRPGRRNVDVIAARTGCVRAIAMSPA
jgi:hypothetical protein